jgi:hypothetical protein
MTVLDLMPSANTMRTASKSKAEPTNGKLRTVGQYDYRDEAGELMFQVLRYDPKDLRQRRPMPGGS